MSAHEIIQLTMCKTLTIIAPGLQPGALGHAEQQTINSFNMTSVKQYKQENHDQIHIKEEKHL